ncbi:MAG TPA: Cna B-type domain-containing protein, partial [Candidatus Egerieimonas intestinavium]|nr:Cna B-type domain-containing protein [Candidatus Egerieimonas intestinavium]
LYANGVELKDKVLTVTEEDGWAWSFTNLPKYENGVQINYTISEDAVTDYTTTVTGYDVTNSYTPGKTSVGVTKSWQDNNNQDGIRPESITVKLLANGKDTGKTLTLSKGNSWAGTFSDLDEYKDGELIKYTVEEEDFTNANQYETVITGNAETGYVITNSHTPATTEVSGSKTWDDGDNQDGKRPESITIRLYADGVELKDKVQTVTEEDSWAWSFTGLPKYEGGREIRYTITEDMVTGYQSEIRGMDVTNRYTPEQISLSVTKNWQDQADADGIRPESITVKLYADGKDTGKKLVLSQKNSWTGSFTDLDEYADGEKIVYTVEEEKVEGYDTVISGNAEKGYVICNSHTPDNPDTPEEPDTPGNSNTPNGGGPQTGDPTSLPLWSGLMAVSGIVLAGTLILARKKRYRGKHTK